MFFRFLLLILIFVGCESPRYKEAYTAAKKLGRSDAYAEALAEKVDEGRDLSYAVPYAMVMSGLQKWDSPYTHEERKKFAELYAEKRQERQSAGVDSFVFVISYCSQLHSLKTRGKSDRYIRAYAPHYLDAQKIIIEKPELVASYSYIPSYVMDFCSEYARQMADGKSKEVAIAAGRKRVDR